MIYVVADGGCDGGVLVMNVVVAVVMEVGVAIVVMVVMVVMEVAVAVMR